jgi:hypothetical protein
MDLCPCLNAALGQSGIAAITPAPAAIEPPSSTVASGLALDANAFSYTSNFSRSAFTCDIRCADRFEPLPVPDPLPVTPLTADMLPVPIDPTFVPNYTPPTITNSAVRVVL